VTAPVVSVVEPSAVPGLRPVTAAGL